MKTTLRLQPHSILNGANVVEIVRDGVVIGCVYGADEPGVRIVSKHEMGLVQLGGRPNAVEIRILEGR